VFIAKTIKQLKSHLAKLDTKTSLGLVPTMGALHQGHLSLVEKAIEENKTVVVSIFVNPTQFNNTGDLDKYPRTLESDTKLLGRIFEQLIIFAPSASEIYPNGQFSESFDFNGLDKVMEGAFREGHFNGVGTIVEKLLLLIEPNKAYFGEKDFQQLQIIRYLVALKKIPVEIIGCPIVREPNGLALSSRNERLSEEIRDKAAFIFKTLQDAKEKFETMSPKKILEWGKGQFASNSDFDLEYLTIAETKTLQSIKIKYPNEKYRLFIAVYTEGVRLIDNIALN